MWEFLARYLARHPALIDRLIMQAKRTPYSHITSQDGQNTYMYRYWLFNPYPMSGADKSWWGRFLPSVRLHQIMRPDQDRHLHDHPWNARTLILRGGYTEQREDGLRHNDAGTTCRLLFGEYHRIVAVSRDGVWTLFITWKYRGTWGFLVDGVKVPWRQYLGL